MAFITPGLVFPAKLLVAANVGFDSLYIFLIDWYDLKF